MILRKCGTRLPDGGFEFPDSREQMDLNQGRFLPNGRCGYVLKPTSCAASPATSTRRTQRGPRHVPTQLTIRIISAQQLPKINTDKRAHRGSPGVGWRSTAWWPSIKHETRRNRIDNNGFNPRWDCTRLPAAGA
ncbi:hypothetical protein INR49_011629 [Caranx melampygus]|nr:hypothetical protein INR49_011629 [Caranx melampygus]